MTGKKPQNISGRYAKGFGHTGQFIRSRVEKASEKRGFSQIRLLTHWEEIVGPDLAALCSPRRVSYSASGFGATLSVACVSAAAPMLEMQKPMLVARVNSAYGYHAIARIKLLHEARALPEKERVPAQPLPELPEDLGASLTVVKNDDLRLALERLGRHIGSRTRRHA